jgi:ferritin-like metal-binding protein YciE
MARTNTTKTTNSNNAKKNGSSMNGSSSMNGKTSKSSTGSSSSEKSGKTLDDLFETELKDMYSAEKQLLEALPEMAKAAYSEDLQDAFEKHLHQTERQVDRLEKIFERLEIDKNEEENCEAMEGLIEEANEIMSEFDRSPVRDSALIIAAQKVEHYEIASYGSLVELADVLGYGKIAEMLERTLEEEKDTDEDLSSIAQDVNDEACEMSHEEEEYA